MTDEEKHLDIAAKYRRLEAGFARLIGAESAKTNEKARQAAKNCANRARRHVDEANQARKKA
jgi:outer membrane murein-binding lipoprotein Lpp